MIILEGPDGSGKSTLQKSLLEAGFEAGPRAVTSEGGVIDRENLVQWVWEDLMTWRSPDQQLRVYDRHPLVSEYIYGPIVRGDVAPGMLSPFAREMGHWFVRNALVIFCLPPLETVQVEVQKEAQMEGVVENIDDIYMSYQLIMLTWGGQYTIYDWTKDTPNRIVRYCKEWEAKSWT